MTDEQLLAALEARIGNEPAPSAPSAPPAQPRQSGGLMTWERMSSMSKTELAAIPDDVFNEIVNKAWRENPNQFKG